MLIPELTEHSAPCDTSCKAAAELPAPTVCQGLHDNADVPSVIRVMASDPAPNYSKPAVTALAEAWDLTVAFHVSPQPAAAAGIEARQLCTLQLRSSLPQLRSQHAQSCSQTDWVLLLQKALPKNHALMPHQEQRRPLHLLQASPT